MPITQQNRILALSTALGDDALAVRSIGVQEQISRLFQIEAELRSEDGTVDFDKVVGNNVTIRLQVANKATRYFNGFVSRLVQLSNQGAHAHYHATIVPWLWFLTRTSDCRIFQQKTAPDIIEAVFKAHGFTDYQLKLTETYPTREYCVQYRETDFNFVSRLMEQEGIYYFFEHDNGKHTLVLADSASASKPFPGYDEIIFHELEKGDAAREVVTDWTIEKEVQPVAYAINDFNFEKPRASLLSNSNVTRQHGAAQFEMYDYPGEYVEQSDGDRLAKVRIEELQTQFEILRGQASARGLAAGFTFTLKSHPRKDQNREYLITSVSLHVDAGEYASGDHSSEFFSCNFSVIDSQQTFRPARLTPKPIVQGPQTAMVVGTKGEEIYTDKYGRVKVIFPWDRYSNADENSSCWIRVSQEWAGKKWGAIYLPRIGQEVIVEFLEGDPDRPIITGRVYNAETMPPYDLPAEKTKSTLKSNSSKGGNGFNEIRLEDKKGSEQIFIHGEKNEDVRIKNDCFEWIGNDRHLVVVNNQLEHIENNRNETVDADHMEKIGKDRHLQVVGKEAKSVGGSLSLTVTGDVIEVFKGNHSEQTTSNYYLKADNIVIEGMTNVTIKVGQSSIAIDSSGISIAATQIQVQGQASVQVDSPQTTVKGDAMLTLKGGMTMIN